jgi:hypothetical protein
MPKLYEYFGLIILFYSNEHEPIHVHGKYQGRENKAELLFEEGKFVGIKVSSVKGKEPLDQKTLKKFKKIVEIYHDDIVEKWVDFFVYNKKVEPEKLTQKI